jgi:hypothetical protein
MNKTYTKEKVLALIGMQESGTLEFKQEVNIEKENRKEFLYDIASFSNNQGGAIIYGIIEKEGEAVGVKSIDKNLDALILTMEMLVRDGIKPVISGIMIYGIDTGSGVVIVVEIPKSWNAPHMVTIGGTNKFYKRGEKGKYLVDVFELKNMFLLQGTIEQKVTDFINERINKILNNDTYVDLGNEGLIAMHLIPINSFGSYPSYNLPSTLKYGYPMISLSNKTYNDSVPNLDGIIAISRGNGQPSAKNAYVQLFRNGIIETVSGQNLYSDDNFKGIPYYVNPPEPNYEGDIEYMIEEFARIHSEVKVSGPQILSVSLINIKGYRLELSSNDITRINAKPIQQNVIVLPNIYIEDLNTFNRRNLKPMFDTVWNASGLPESRSFDKNGDWHLYW